jgi:glycosyltransferase involved in cell wall biosynthesis
VILAPRSGGCYRLGAFGKRGASPSKDHPVRVALYRNYREEQQPSMRIYADMLARHLPAIEGVTVRDVRPAEIVPDAMRSVRLAAKLGDFGGRYVLHPLSVRRRDSDVHHIVDHGTAHLLLALDEARTVVTCHDLVPLLTHRGRLPRGQVPIGARTIFRGVVRLLPRARVLLTVSRSTKDDLVQELGCDEGRIRVVHLGLQDEHLAPRSERELLEAEVRLRLGARPRLLSVGGTWPHKNLRGVLEVFARVRRRQARATLVRVGPSLPDDLRERARELGVLDGIVELGRTSVDELACVYRLCDVLLFPSYYEGFGWPPLEAMVAGLPVVSSPCGSVPEVSGDIPLYAAPDDHDGLGAAALSLLDDGAARRERIRRGRAHASRFTWAETARETAAVYRELLAPGER